jgi:hypothetical protein
MFALTIMALFFVISYAYQNFHHSAADTFTAEKGQQIDNTGSFVLRGESIKGSTYDFITDNKALDKLGISVNDKDYKATNTGGLLGMKPTDYDLTIPASELGFKDGVKITRIVIHRKFSFMPLISTQSINGTTDKPIVTIGSPAAPVPVALTNQDVVCQTLWNKDQVEIRMKALGASFGKKEDLKITVATQPISADLVDYLPPDQIVLHLDSSVAASLPPNFAVSLQVTGQQPLILPPQTVPPKPTPVPTTPGTTTGPGPDSTTSSTATSTTSTTGPTGSSTDGPGGGPATSDSVHYQKYFGVDGSSPTAAPGELFPQTRRDPSLSSSFINNLSAKDARYAINEIYARHQADFTNPVVKGEFQNFEWYKGGPEGRTDAEAKDLFTENEKANFGALVAREGVLKK